MCSWFGKPIVGLTDKYNGQDNPCTYLARWMPTYGKQPTRMHMNSALRGPDHLLRIEIGEETNSLEEGLPDTHLFVVRVADGHFEDIIHFLKMGTTLKEYSVQQKKELVVRTINFSVIAGYLYKWAIMR